MGFLDRAKKLADQAQAKLDDVQQQFHESQKRGDDAAGADAPAAEYDEHGRAVARDEEPPHGDPLAAAAAPEPPAEKGPTLAAPEPPAEKGPTLQPEPTDPDPPHGDPLADAPAAKTPPSGANPGMTSGDPLAG
jgi:hypothetical protein